MALGDNPVIPLFESGERITCAASAAITAGRFVKISGNIQAGPLLDVSTPTGPLVKGNLLVVALCVAGDRAFGVSGWDAPSVDDVLPVLNGPGMVVPMVAGAAIAAGVEVQADAAGAAITLAAGKSNGMAVSAAVNNVVFVRLFT
jgi:hypothetical protein